MPTAPWHCRAAVCRGLYFGQMFRQGGMRVGKDWFYRNGKYRKRHFKRASQDARPEDMIFSAAHQDKMEAVTARTKGAPCPVPTGNVQRPGEVSDTGGKAPVF